MKFYKAFLIIGTLLLITLSDIFAASNRVTIQGKELFLNGINIAWNKYANDVGDTPIDENKFKEIVVDVRSAGGNTLRWWLSTNGANDPKFDPTTGLVSGLGTETINNVKKVLDICEANGVVVSLCLLTHNYLQDQVGMNVENNKKLLTTDEGLQAYIDNALVPLVTAIGNHPAIACWEIFNEPEGMVDGLGWAVHADGSGFTMEKLQIVVNRCAGAIKRVNDSLLVSNGTHTFKYLTDVGSFKNYYSDSALIAAGGDSLGKLDFYQVHFYPQHQGDDTSPFHHPASYWGLDKPIVIGEFPNVGCVPIDGVFKPSSQLTPTEAFNYLYDNGYAGGLAWSYTGHDGLGKFEDSKPGILDLYNKHYDDIYISDLTADTSGGNYAMKVDLTGLSETTNKEWVDLMYSQDLSSESKLSLNIKINSVASGESVKIRFATQSGGWKWKQVQNFYTVPNDGAWHTYEILFSDMAGVVLDNMQSIILQISPVSSEIFNGSIFIDSVKTESKMISDFDDQYSLWEKGSQSVAISEISAVKIDAVDAGPSLWSKPLPQGLSIFQKGNKVMLVGLNSNDKIGLYSLRGAHIEMSDFSIGNSVACFDVPSAKGIYILNVKSGGNLFSKRLIVK